MNLNVLAGVCDTTLQPVIKIAHIVVTALQIGIPLILIILGMIDLGKAVIASKEDEVKKATKGLGRRFLYAVGVFLVVWVVKVVFNNVGKIFNTGDVTGTQDYQDCWACIASPDGDNCHWGSNLLD